MANYKQGHYKGKPTFSIPSAYLKAALNLLILGSDQLRQKNFVKQLCRSQKNRKKKTLENTITIELVNEIQKEQETYKIRAEPLSLNLVHPLTNIKYSQIDIKFTWDNYSPNGYLAVEAKLLFGEGKRHGGLYVEEGVLDFIEGRYSYGHSHGIMLGYILSKPIDEAIVAVKKALEKRKAKTNEKIPFNKVGGFVAHSLIFETVHIQRYTGTEIMLLHLFADFAS